MPRTKRYRREITQPSPTSTPTPTPTPTPIPSIAPSTSHIPHSSHIPSSSTIPTPLTSNSIASSSHTSGRKNNKFRIVTVIDEKGNEEPMKLNVARVWTLPPGKKVKVKFNRDHQPINEEGALLNSFLADLASDVKVLPISYRGWRKVPKADKDRCYNNFLKEKFQFNESIGEKYMRGALAKDWKDNRHRLFKELYKVECSREDNIEDHPPGIPKEQWAAFIDYRLEPKTMKMCETNTANRKKLITPHTGGSKSLARKREEMESELGKELGRGAMYIVNHTKKDGSYVNDAAKDICEKIIEIESEQSSSQKIGPHDSLAQVLGPEHSGRVRGLGFGPTPSHVFGLSTTSSTSRNSTNDSNKITQLESQLKAETELRKKMQSCVKYMFKNMFGNTAPPPEFASIMDVDEEIPSDVRPSSSSSHAP